MNTESKPMGNERLSEAEIASIEKYGLQALPYDKRPDALLWLCQQAKSPAASAECAGLPDINIIYELNGVNAVLVKRSEIDALRTRATETIAALTQDRDDQKDDALRLHREKCDALEKLIVADQTIAADRAEIVDLRNKLSIEAKCYAAIHKIKESLSAKLAEREGRIAELLHTLGFAHDHLKQLNPNGEYPQIDAALTPPQPDAEDEQQ